MYSNEMTGLRRSVFYKTAVGFLVFTLLLMLLITFIMGNTNRRNFENAVGPQWKALAGAVGPLVDGKKPEELTGEEKAALSGLLADFVQALQYRDAPADAVLCFTDGGSTRTVLHAGFGTASFQDEDGKEVYVFFDEYLSAEDMWTLLHQAQNPWYDPEARNVLWGYEQNGEIIPQKLEIIQQGRVYWRKEFQPQRVVGLELREYRDVIFYMPDFDAYWSYGGVKAFQSSRDRTARMIEVGLPEKVHSDFAYGMEKPGKPDGDASAEQPYTLLYATDFHPFLLAAKQLLYVYLFGILAAGFLLNIVSGELARYITEPIEGLSRAALKMASGDRNVAYTVEKGRKDEIAELANSLNAMSRNLNTAMDRLQGEYDRQVEREKQRRELTSAIAHELKTPLGIIHGYCEGLQENIREEKRDHYLGVILDETEKMDALVLEMLDLSKLESEAYRLRVESFSLGELAREEVERYRPAAQQKGLHLEVRTDGDGVMTADRGRIAQVVSNFLSNAVRHTPEGGAVQVHVTQEKGLLRVEVENEGPPIPEEQIDKIWNVFYKGDASRERAKGGTGLGLAIAQNILELHGLEYGACNTEGGVCFWFSQKQQESPCSKR